MTSNVLVATGDEAALVAAPSNVAVGVDNVCKFYETVAALRGVSFNVKRGEIFGLLGPNGAGKSSLIRIILDMIRPDSGQVTLFGRPLARSDRGRIGYLPEERGLYLSRKVLQVIEYFGVLKGMASADARQNGLEWLDRLDMAAVKDKRIGELSKGNQQKIQLAATLVNRPEIAILDEPFSGLDPVSVRLIAAVIREVRDAGATVMLSSHQMSLVENLCDRVFMVNKGRGVLYGTIEEVRREHSDNAVVIRCSAETLRNVPGVLRESPGEKGTKIYLEEGVLPSEFLNAVLATGARVDYFERALTPLEEIFVKLVQKDAAGASQP